MIATFNEPIGGLKWIHMISHRPKFPIQNKKPVFGPKKKFQTKIDNLIVSSVQKMIKVPSFIKFGKL